MFLSNLYKNQVGCSTIQFKNMDMNVNKRVCLHTVYSFPISSLHQNLASLSCKINWHRNWCCFALKLEKNLVCANKVIMGYYHIHFLAFTSKLCNLLSKIRTNFQNMNPEINKSEEKHEAGVCVKTLGVHNFPIY